MHLRDLAKNWLPAILWAGVIYILSTDTFSSAHTSKILIPLLHRIFPGAGLDALELMHAAIRKSAHLAEYFLLGLLLYGAVRGKERGWKLKWAAWAVAIAAGYAACDEFHQAFVPSRTASPWDALLDTVGASAAQVAVWWRWKRRRGRES